MTKSTARPTHPLAETERVFLIRPFLIETDPQETHEPPHRHNFQEILWVRSGRGKHAIDGRELTIQPNTFYLIAKRQVHQLITGIELDGLTIRLWPVSSPCHQRAQPEAGPSEQAELVSSNLAGE